MENKSTDPKPGSDLGYQAETILKEGREGSVKSKIDGVDTDIQSLVHELQVHQIELEMQNDELRRAKLEAEDARAKYSDLYEFAPIGLLTIDD